MIYHYIDPTKNSIVQGTGLDFLDEQMNEAEEIQENEVDDYDDDWEPYGLDDL
jgi:hypothetical protein